MNGGISTLRGPGPHSVREHWAPAERHHIKLSFIQTVCGIMALLQNGEAYCCRFFIVATSNTQSVLFT